MVEEEMEISQFNEAVNQILRVNEIWVRCHQARRNGKYEEWRKELENAEIEFIYDARKLDNTKGTNYIQQLEKVNKAITNAKTFKDLHKALREKEIIIREVQNESGKGAKYRPVDEDLM